MIEKTQVRAAPVPSKRGSRLFKLGALAGRIATNVVVEGGKQLAQGKRPKTRDLLLTSQNLHQVADKLARMRGAAMKLGQLLSMDTGTLLPPELSAVLARLQAQGMIMPKTQLLSALESNWGEDWMDRFSYFSFDPVAAASIGQVHEARTHDGEHLAVKVQFPGVRQSIDADIDNVLGLLRVSGLLPKGLDIAPLVDEARRQLKREADYHVEAESLAKFRDLLLCSPSASQFLIPDVNLAYSSQDILSMSFIQGESLEAWIGSSDERAALQLGRMLELFFTELLQFNLMQTDPNPANFHVSTETGQLILYDFGAVRAFGVKFVANYRAAIDAAVAEDREVLLNALSTLGFFNQGVDVSNRELILDIFILAAEPLRSDKPYNFGASELAMRIQQKALSASRDPNAWHTPPADVLFLHRKMAGLYLTAAKFRATVDVAAIYRKVAKDQRSFL